MTILGVPVEMLRNSTGGEDTEHNERDGIGKVESFYNG